jgi:hypothetical protein
MSVLDRLSRFFSSPEKQLRKQLRKQLPDTVDLADLHFPSGARRTVLHLPEFHLANGMTRERLDEIQALHDLQVEVIDALLNVHDRISLVYENLVSGDQGELMEFAKKNEVFGTLDGVTYTRGAFRAAVKHAGRVELVGPYDQTQFEETMKLLGAKRKVDAMLRGNSVVGFPEDSFCYGSLQVRNAFLQGTSDPDLVDLYYAMWSYEKKIQEKFYANRTKAAEGEINTALNLDRPLTLVVSGVRHRSITSAIAHEASSVNFATVLPTNPPKGFILDEESISADARHFPDRQGRTCQYRKEKGVKPRPFAASISNRIIEQRDRILRSELGI